jgi:aerobic-type carbon monoxide dehydrogenase small subunit (CoxS/CutS family)
MADVESPRGVSRRGFLGRAGAAAGVAGCLAGAEVAAADEAPAIQGPGHAPIVLRVNGVRRRLEVEPRATLAEVLRGPLALTGTKIGCDRGACSACTVWLNGAPVAACMMLAIDADGQAITTIEGLADGDTLHAVQAAFIAHDAVQCGYCTPGMVMSCAALLRDNPRPTEAEVRAAIAGHVCRCGTYPHIVAAVLSVARREG